MPTAAGHNVRVSYLWEEDGDGNPDFATESTEDTDHKPFGSDASLTTADGSNQAVRVFDPNSREAREVIEQMFSGSWGVEFTLTNPWWLRGLLHFDPDSTGSSAPYTHSWTGDVPFPMQLVIGNETTGNERILRGAVIVSGTISVGVGGMVTVSLEGAYADEDLNEGVSLTEQPAINERPMTFAQATLQRDGTTLSLIQNAQLSIENNTDLIPELGNRTAVAYSPKVRSITISYTDIVEDDDDIQRMYGSATATSPQTTVENEEDAAFVFDNGKTGDEQNTLRLDLDGLFPDGYSRTGQGDPEADLEGTLSEIPATITAQAENSTAEAR